MNRLVFFVSFLLLNLCLFNLPVQAQNCKPGNTRNTAYMLRENDRRCEGINTPEVGNDFFINSFTIGQLQPSKNLTIFIPKTPNLAKPTVRVQSIKYYQLDPLDLKDQGQKWQFQWSSEVLQQENISPAILRSVAKSGDIIIPVFYSKPSNFAYNISIYTGGYTQTITLQIQQNNGTLIYSETRKNQPGKEVSFTWNGKDQKGKLVPKGRYTLKVTATVEQLNAPPENRSLTRQFEHNPTWLN